MGLKRRFMFVLMLLGWTSNVFGNDFEEEQLIFQAIETTSVILEQFPQVITSCEHDRAYLRSDRVRPIDQGVYLLLDSNQTCYLPKGFVLSDATGCFLPTSYAILAKKPFKNVCLTCKHEWEGGVFTVRCPKCYSTDIVNVPNT